MKKDYDKDVILLTKMTPTEAGVFLYVNYIKDNEYLWSDLKDLGFSVNRHPSFPKNILLLTQSIVMSIDKEKFDEDDLLRKFPWLKN